MEALKRSYYLAINNAIPLLIIWILIFIFNIAGFLLTVMVGGLGLLITLPISLLCYTKLYLLINESETI